MKILSAVAALIFFAVGAMAETTNDLSDVEIQGRNLARKILEQTPATNFVQNGVFNIRDGKGNRSEIPFRFQTSVTSTIWSTTYETISDSNHVSLVVIHETGKANRYELYNGAPLALALPKFLAGNETMIPFAGSDFWLADLGLEFFHWPEQKILKKEVKRSRGCSVLESTNPDPSTNGYSRVVSWIDNDGGGIVQAFAYDAQGKKLKEFYPKNLEKVNGQYQVQEMEMDNVQTGSRSRLEFDLNKQ
ncbi:MAG TPA: outer membrane lipoprotein-sorting protein [Verrucomicrobiae bacterium]|jgi:hypothetical protein|nr:outer membrane lipoprotein-sorting protein [Verrucomicrobiae bacterium]